MSLVGTFAALQALGFSINLLTLLALVLSIGLLVDDAIVVMENVYRRQELGEPPRLAALNGSKEVGFAVIATTVAVVAVLVPLSLMTGNTGRLFREFAISLAVAVSISTFVALTLVPMLCSRFLKVRAELRPDLPGDRAHPDGRPGHLRAGCWARASHAAQAWAVLLLGIVVASVLALPDDPLDLPAHRGSRSRLHRDPRARRAPPPPTRDRR